MRELFLLDPDVVFLNHGSFGACPRPVFAEYQRLQLELEREPVEFLGLKRSYPRRAGEARRRLAEYVGARPDDLVLVPNATAGVNMVARSLDLFLTTPLFMIGETSLFVRHNLLRKLNSFDGIGAVCAHPQALAQCHTWLNDHLPEAERKPVASNAEGARLASLDPTLAAIASTRAGSEWGLHVVSPAIQDDANNRTRFAVITHPERHPVPRASGHDCTSLVVSVRNRPGAVHDLLVPLKENGVSMTRFESRPARSGQWEYYFYIDIQGHPDQAHVGVALKELRDACAFFKVLGTYPIDVH